MTLPAARLTDNHVCPMWTGVVPHVAGPISGPGAATVMIGNMPAAIMGDMAVCSGPPDTLMASAVTVLITNKPAVRLTDITAHGGTVVGPGCPTVLIGGPAPPAPPPPSGPPEDMSEDEVALMLSGASEEDLEEYKAMKEDEDMTEAELEKYRKDKEEEKKQK